MDINLVKGAASLGQSKRSTYADAMQKSLQSASQAYSIVNAKKQAEKQKINATVGGYIDNLNSEVDLTQLNSTQQMAVTNFLVENKNAYANAASEIARLDDPSDPRYMELREKMNSVQNSFKNLAGQVNGYKEDKVAYLKDFDDRRISDGNDISALSSASKIYTDGGDFGISEGGNLNFWNNDKEEYESYTDVEKPFLKDFKSANNILSLNEKVYSAGSSLSGARQNMIRNKLKNMINSGGRDTLLSLASDDFLIEGGLNLSDPSLFDPANQDLLQDAVLNSYMDALSDTAAQGARDKKPARGKGSGGFSGALQDEINLSGPVVEEAMQFSNLSQMPEANKATAVAQFINSTNLSSKSMPYISRSEFFEDFMEVKDYDDDEIAEAEQAFIKEYGNYQIFKYNGSNPGDSRGINVDINNPQSLYKFYLQNSNLGSKATNYHLGNWDKYSGSAEQKQETKEEETSTNNFG
jgi:hypothetical protein|tara:strand:+ start:331 stop:1734 length:1404 start_codon:yes stop_codon:yes gene_type:complete